MGEINTVAQGIVDLLAIMYRAAPKDRERMRLVLRERLQDFADTIMRVADNSGE